MKRGYKWLLVILWMILIFLFSSESGITSTGTSNFFVKRVAFLEYIGISSSTLTFLIRKSAHFFLYFILGILVLNAISGIRKAWLVSLLFCLLYACTDEVHQLFVIGRSGELKDVLVDFIGSILGIYCMCHFHKSKIA